MNIAVLSKRTVFHKGYGGLETQSQMLCEGFVKRGHKVTVFSPNWELTNDTLEKNGVKYVFIKCIYRMGPFFGFFGTKDAGNYFNKSFEILKFFHEKEKFDIVLGQSSSAIGVIKKKEDLELKIISVAHGSIVSEYTTFIRSMILPRDLILFIQNTGFALKNFFTRQREFVHGSDKIICVSNYVKNALSEETFTPENRFEVVHNGVDISAFENVQLTQRKTKALHVGRIEKSKGISDLITLFGNGPLSKYEIDIIGTGDFFGEAQKRSRKYNNIHFVGKIDYAELLTKYYKNSDYGVFVFPTKRVEGFPMVLVEAALAGLPIVAYDMGGVSDAIQNEGTGFVIKSDDIKTFAEKTKFILENTQVRQEMGNNAHAFAKENFSLINMVDKYIQVMQEVLTK